MAREENIQLSFSEGLERYQALSRQLVERLAEPEQIDFTLLELQVNQPNSQDSAVHDFLKSTATMVDSLSCLDDEDINDSLDFAKVKFQDFRNLFIELLPDHVFSAALQEDKPVSHFLEHGYWSGLVEILKNTNIFDDLDVEECAQVVYLEEIGFIEKIKATTENQRKAYELDLAERFLKDPESVGSFISNYVSELVSYNFLGPNSDTKAQPIDYILIETEAALASLLIVYKQVSHLDKANNVSFVARPEQKIFMYAGKIMTQTWSRVQVNFLNNATYEEKINQDLRQARHDEIVFARACLTYAVSLLSDLTSLSDDSIIRKTLELDQ